MRTTGTTGRAARRGNAVVVVLVVMVAIIVASGAFVRVSSAVTSRLARGVEDDQARYLAEAGVREGVEAIRQGFSGAVGDQVTPAYLGGGVFWVEATPLADGNVSLRSTAMIGSGRASVAAVVKGGLSDPPLFSATLSSKDKLTLNEGVLIDSFDSSVGSYSSQAVNTLGLLSYANNQGHVKSEKDIELNANASLFGDANPGMGYTVASAPSSYIDGSIAPQTEPQTFPPVEIPVVDQSTSLSMGPNSSAGIGPGIVGYDQLSIGKAATLTVTGPATVVVNDFSGLKDANLVIDAVNGPVTFVVADTYFHGNAFEVQAALGSPLAAAFMIAGTTDVVFPASTKINGAYYAPNANLNFSSGNEAWGSFVGNQVNMSNDMNFHYDETLAHYWKADGNKLDEEIVLWMDSGVSSSNILADRRDPDIVLGVDKEALPMPVDAWKP